VCLHYLINDLTYYVLAWYDDSVRLRCGDCQSVVTCVMTLCACVHKFSQINLTDKRCWAVHNLSPSNTLRVHKTNVRSLRSIGFCSDQNLRPAGRTCHVHFALRCVHFGRKFRKTNAGNLAKVVERVTITVKVSIIGESAIFNQFNDFGVPDDAIFTAVCALPLIKTGVIYVA